MRSAEERLSAAGLRVTAPRVAVLRALDAADDHPPVERLMERLRALGTPISTQGAYDVCEALHRAGLARRLDPGPGPARFESRVGDNHHHLVCRGCGRVADVDCDLGASPCLDPGDRRGFAIDEAEITFWGLCPDCRNDTTERIST
jgi:Fur family transcriptional regulator, stress-responsive regulator